MKKSNLTRSLLAACSIVALSAVMYGCSSSGEDAAISDRDMLQAELDALNEAAMGELAEGEKLSPEVIAALIAARDAADTAAANAEAAKMMADQAAATAEAARTAAEAAQATAEGERDAANMAAAAAAAAQATAEGERDAANMAAAAAAAAQATAEGARDMANQRAMDAAAAQATAEQAAAAAAAAQGMAEGERDAANMAAAAAAAAQATAEGERDAANMAAAAAAAAQATAEGARDMANQRAMDAAAAQATAEQAAEAAAAAQGMAEGERDAANMAAAAAATAQTTAEGERDAANMAAAAAATAQTTAEGERDAAVLRAETAESELAEVRKKAAAALAEADKKEMIAREAAVRTAIGTNRVGTGAKAFPTGITELAATRDAAGAVAIDVNGDDDDAYTGGETAAGSGDWNSVTMTKTDAATEATDTLVIYTDIEAPSDKLLTAQYTQDQLDDALNVTTVAKAMSAGFPSAPGTTWTYTGAEDERAKTVTGMFDGVPGQFTCTVTTDCTVMTDADGKLEAAENWRFTPKSPLDATVKDPDDAYAYFGWWLNKPKANDGTHDVEVFAGATSDHEGDVNNEIVGSASYMGPAAGKYVTKSFTAGVHSESSVGHFTATANLTAKFGADDAAGTVGGMVNGFELDDGKTPNWAVTLEDATLSPTSATQHVFPLI